MTALCQYFPSELETKTFRVYMLRCGAVTLADSHAAEGEIPRYFGSSCDCAIGGTRSG